MSWHNTPTEMSFRRVIVCSLVFACLENLVVQPGASHVPNAMASSALSGFVMSQALALPLTTARSFARFTPNRIWLAVGSLVLAAHLAPFAAPAQTPPVKESSPPISIPTPRTPGTSDTPKIHIDPIKVPVVDPASNNLLGKLPLETDEQNALSYQQVDSKTHEVRTLHFVRGYPRELVGPREAKNKDELHMIDDFRKRLPKSTPGNLPILFGSMPEFKDYPIATFPIYFQQGSGPVHLEPGVVFNTDYVPEALPNSVPRSLYEEHEILHLPRVWHRSYDVLAWASEIVSRTPADFQDRRQLEVWLC